MVFMQSSSILPERDALLQSPSEELDIIRQQNNIYSALTMAQIYP